MNTIWFSYAWLSVSLRIHCWKSPPLHGERQRGRNSSCRIQLHSNQNNAALPERGYLYPPYSDLFRMALKQKDAPPDPHEFPLSLNTDINAAVRF